MKRRLLALILIAFPLLIALAPLVYQVPTIAIAHANSPSPDSKNHISLTLTSNNADPSNYSVSGTIKSSDVSFKYNANSRTFLSDGLTGTGGGGDNSCGGNAATQQANTVRVLVKLGSQQVGSQSYNLCGRGSPYVFDEALAVTNPSGGPSQQPGCVSGKLTYTSQQGGTKKPFQSSATGTLQGPNGQSYPLKFDNNGNLQKICQLLPGSYTLTADYTPQSPQDGVQDRHVNQTFTLGSGENKAINANGDPGTGAIPTNTATPDTKPLTCETHFTNPLTWILCPVIDILTSVVDTVDGWITDELCINTNQIFYTSGSCGNNSLTGSDQKSSGAYYKAWSDFRNIALGLMAIAGLVIVISQALGMEILDAYTIRKTLPRLLIVAIGITLSWPIMQFLVTMSNDLGFGIRHLIYAPFSGLGNGIDLRFAHTFVGGIGNFLLGSVALVAGAAAAVAFIGIIFSLAGTAALAVFIAIMVLILREVAIILLILISPIAIVMYILPNTQRVYKLWWESFSKALLMFPLIAAFIAVGRVFSAVTLNADHSILGKIIGFLAYFAPYFLIPVTFRLAGGAIRNIGGFVNDRGRGAFDRLKQGRARQMKQVGQDIYAGQATRLFGAARDGSFRDRYNKGLQKVAHVGSAGLRPSMWKENIAQSVSGLDVKGTSKELQNDEAFGAIRGNDTLAEALSSNDFDVEKARATLTRNPKVGKVKADQMISAYTVAGRALRRKGFSERAIQTATVLSGATASTAYTRDEDYEPVYDADGNRMLDADGKPVKGAYLGGANLTATLARLSGGDANLMAQMTAGAIEATNERPELMPSFSEGFEVMQNIQAASSKSPAERQAQIAASAKTLRQTAIRKKGINVLFGNGHTARHMAKEYEDMINDSYQQHIEARQSGTPDQKAQSEDRWMQMVAEMAAAQENARNLPLEKRPVIGNLVAHELAPGVTVQSETNTYRTNKQFQKYFSDFYMQQRGAIDPAVANAAQDALANAEGAAPPPAAPPAG